MTKIKDINITHLRVPFLRNFISDVYDRAKECETVTTKMLRAFLPLEKTYLAMVEAYNIAIKSPETDKITQLDALRDILVSAIRSTTRAGAKSLVTSMRNHAMIIQQTLKSFKVNTRDTYPAETTEIRTQTDVLLEQHRESLVALGIEELVMRLKNANDEFTNLVAERNEEYALVRPRGLRPNAVRDAIDAYRAFVEYVNAYRLVIVDEEHPDEDLDSFIDLVNVIIARYKKSMKSRKHNLKDAETDITEEISVEEVDIPE